MASKKPSTDDPERDNATQARAPRPREGTQATRLGRLDAMEDDARNRTRDVLAASDAPEDAESTRIGLPARLEVVEGPDTGEARKLRAVRMVIGRTAGVDWQLSDDAVSRRHAEIIKSDQGVVVRDLQSGHGTHVNGERITERKLVDGDEITLGVTRLRFVDEAAALQRAQEARAREQQEVEAAVAAAVEADAALAPHTSGLPMPLESANPRKRLAVRVAAVAVALLVVAGLYKKISGPSAQQRARMEALVVLQQARDAVKAEQFDKAIAFVKQAEEISPGVDTTGLRRQAEEELSIQAGFVRVKQLLGEGRPLEAQDALAKVGMGSLKTEERRTQLAREVTEAVLGDVKKVFAERLQSGNLDEARALLPLFPDEAVRDAVDQLDRADEARIERERLDAAANKSAAARRAAQARTQREQEILGIFTLVSRKYGAHEWDRAAKECDRVMETHLGDDEVQKRARNVQKLIPQFAAAFEDGMAKYRKGALSQAVAPLKRARVLYDSIGLPGPMIVDIRESLVKAAVAAGREALARDDALGAAFHFRDALRIDPTDERAKAGLAEVIDESENLFAAAYIDKDTNVKEAVRKLKMILDFVPRGHPVRAKAEKLLEQLGGG